MNKENGLITQLLINKIKKNRERKVYRKRLNDKFNTKLYNDARKKGMSEQDAWLKFKATPKEIKKYNKKQNRIKHRQQRVSKRTSRKLPIAKVDGKYRRIQLRKKLPTKQYAIYKYPKIKWKKHKSYGRYINNKGSYTITRRY